MDGSGTEESETSGWPPSVEAELEALWKRRVDLLVSEGMDRPSAQASATVEVYGGDVIAVPGAPDHRILEARKITGDA